MSAIDMAERYIDLGWRIFPLKPRSKQPATPHGFKDASRDPEDAHMRWWGVDPTLNIGIATGEASGVFVLDVDPRNAGDETLGALERRFGHLPKTPRALTGGADQGQHFYFRCPPGVTLRGTLGDGLDVKNGGGYVVAPPSIHPDTGKAYAWDLGALPSETPIADAPPWMLEALTSDSVCSPLTAIPGSDARDTVLGHAFELAGMLRAAKPNGIRAVVCPWAAEHTDGRGTGKDDSTCIMPPTTAARWGAFSCRHAHCAGRKFADVMEALPREHVRAAREKYAVAAGPSTEHDLDTGEVHDLASRVRGWTREKGLPRFPLGFETLDAACRGGFAAPRVVIVGGAPGAAKTTLAVGALVRAARLGHPCVMLAADEDVDDILQRVGQLHGIARQALEARDPPDVAALATILDALPNLSVMDGDEHTIEDAFAWLKQHASADLPGVFVCDSVQTARTKRSAELETRHRVDDVIKTIKRETKRLRLVSLATSEISRAFYRSVKTIEDLNDLAAFKESGGIEYAAKTCLLMRSVPDSDDLFEVGVPKNRGGKKRAFRLRIDEHTTALTEIELPAEEHEAKAPPVDASSAEKVSRVIAKSPGIGTRALREKTGLRPQKLYPALEQLEGQGRIANRPVMRGTVEYAHWHLVNGGG